jgi:hypothetical protein
MTHEPIALHRWTAEIRYRHNDGIRSRHVSFAEISELHDIVEDGPNFYAIEKIVIGPARLADAMTVEQSEEM